MASTIAIAGISSRLALLIAEDLLKRPNVHLRGSSRDCKKLPHALQVNPRVTLVQTGPYDRENLRSLIRGSEVVICTYFADNDVMINGQKLLIDLCEEEQIGRYICSDYTFDYTRLDWGDFILKDAMKHVKAYVDGKATVCGVHILVGLFMDAFWDHVLGWNEAEKTVKYHGIGTETWELTTYHTTAQYTAAVALDTSAQGTLRFIGDRRSVIDAAHDYQVLTGIEPRMECLGSLEDVRKQINTGDEQNILAAAQYYILSGKFRVGEPIDNGRYPEVRPATLMDYFKNHKRGASVL